MVQTRGDNQLGIGNYELTNILQASQNQAHQGNLINHGSDSGGLSEP